LNVRSVGVDGARNIAVLGVLIRVGAGHSGGGSVEELGVFNQIAVALVVVAAGSAERLGASDQVVDGCGVHELGVPLVVLAGGDDLQASNAGQVGVVLVVTSRGVESGVTRTSASVGSILANVDNVGQLSSGGQQVLVGGGGEALVVNVETAVGALSEVISRV